MKVLPQSHDGRSETDAIDVETDETDAASNIFIRVNGETLGSLFFGRDDRGQLYVTFGAYDENREWWEAASPEHSQGHAELASLVVPDQKPDLRPTRTAEDDDADIKGCSCGQADYGAPGHDGDPNSPGHPAS